jgi:hypothetical protein
VIYSSPNDVRDTRQNGFIENTADKRSKSPRPIILALREQLTINFKEKGHLARCGKIRKRNHNRLMRLVRRPTTLARRLPRLSLFPHPLSPTNPGASPRWISRSMPSTARTVATRRPRVSPPRTGKCTARRRRAIRISPVTSATSVEPTGGRVVVAYRRQHRLFPATPVESKGAARME